MKILVIGLNPSKKSGSSGTLKRLYQWLDILGIRIISFTNLYEGYETKGQPTTIKFIQTISKDYDKIISLGGIVKNHLFHVGINHGHLPHPSGLNRKLNDKQFVHDQLELCKNYIWSDYGIL